MGKKEKKVHEVKFNLKAVDAENLWAMISNAQGPKLGDEAGISWKIYELRLTLEGHQEEPDTEYEVIQTPNGPIGSPKRQVYCKKNDLSLHYFPKTMEWVIRRSFLKILKLIVKASVASTDGATFANMVKLCKTLRLSAWFRATFNKVVTIDLGDDDRDLDDELDPEDLVDVGEDEEEEDDELDPEPVPGIEAPPEPEDRESARSSPSEESTTE